MMVPKADTPEKLDAESNPNVQFHPLPEPHVTSLKSRTPVEIMADSATESKLPVRTSEALKVAEVESTPRVEPQEVQETINGLGDVISSLGETIAETEHVVKRVDVEIFGGRNTQEEQKNESDIGEDIEMSSDEDMQLTSNVLRAESERVVLDSSEIANSSSLSIAFDDLASLTEVDALEEDETSDSPKLKKSIDEELDIHLKALEPLEDQEERPEESEPEERPESPSDALDEAETIQEEYKDLDSKACDKEEDAPEESEEDAPEASDAEDSEYLRLVEEEMNSLKSIDLADSRDLEAAAAEELRSLNEIDMHAKSLDPSNQSDAIEINMSSETNLDEYCIESDSVAVEFSSESNIDDLVTDDSPKKQEDMSFKRITIQHMNKGVCINVDVNPKTTIYQVKRQIWQSNSILVVGQILKSRNRILGNSELIGNIGILKKGRALKLEVKTIQNVENWNVSDVCAWCSVHPHLRDYSKVFLENSVDGTALVNLDGDMLNSFGFDDEAKRIFLREIPLLKQCFLVNERQRQRSESVILSLQDAVKMSKKKVPSFKEWSPKRTVKFFNQKKRLRKYENIWLSNEITGERLIQLDELELEKMGVKSQSDRKTILMLAQKVKRSKQKMMPLSPVSDMSSLATKWENAV